MLPVAGCSPRLRDPAPAGPPAPEACQVPVGDSPALRRLTQTEINNTLRDLLGDVSAPAANFAPDPEVSGFKNNSSALNVTDLLASQIFSAADDLATAAVNERLGALLPCLPSESGCANRFIEAFGRRAWRRPLTVDEQVLLFQLFQTGGSFDEGARLVIRRLLVSPYFLYRFEMGDPGVTPPAGTQAIRLTRYELASRLSYFLTQSMPDDALLDAAAAGDLDTPERLAAQAQRLLGDWRARGAVAEFFDQWLGFSKVLTVPKDATLFPEFTPRVRLSMVQEGLAFTSALFWNGGDARGLLTATDTWLDPALADYYGATRADGLGFTTSPLPAGQQRAGVLSLGAIAATYSYANQISPVHRGKFVRNRLLCQELAPPPPNVDNKPPKVDPASTLRQRWAQHAADPGCAGCHRLTDPIGFGTSNLDAAGRWQASEGGTPVDASGEIVRLDDGEGAGPFNGIAELGARLAGSSDVHDCFARQWFRFALGRLDVPADACAISRLSAALVGKQFNLQELVLAIVQSDAFRLRTVIDPSSGLEGQSQEGK